MMGSPNILVVLLLWSWPAIAVALFSFMTPRRALIVGYVFGWLFLPQMGFPLPFIRWDKHTATSIGAILGVLIFDTQRLKTFRPALVDLPMVVWCMVYYAASTSNGLGPYDGLSSSMAEVMKWGVPYFLGRIYYGDLAGIRGLAVWMFIGGVVYIPFCLAEIAISPQLHFLTYGFYQHEFTQVIRMGGYRPMVYLQHGIAVGNMMTAASLMGIWLWWTGSLKKVWGMPMWLPLGALVATAVAVKSTGALGMLAAGVFVLFGTRIIKNYLLVIALCVVPWVYMAARTVGGWDGQSAVTLIAQNLGVERSLSLQCRFDNENLLLEKAMKKPVFGWGPNGANLVTREDGTIESIPDGLWVICVGSTGVVGLCALWAAMILPIFLLRRRLPASEWSNPLVAGAAALAVMVLLHSADNLMNAMLNPLFIIGLGALSGVAAGQAERAAAPVRNVGFDVLVGQRKIA